MTTDYGKKLLFKKNQKKYLRYCPKCLKEDRARHGEGYWHREHQLYPVRICAKHGCLLKECKEIKVDAKESPKLVSLEAVVEEDDGKAENVGEVGREQRQEQEQDKGQEQISEAEIDLARFIVGMLERGVRYKENEEEKEDGGSEGGVSGADGNGVDGNGVAVDDNAAAVTAGAISDINLSLLPSSVASQLLPSAVFPVSYLSPSSAMSAASPSSSGVSSTPLDLPDLPDSSILSRWMHSQLYGTKYVSKRGQKRMTQELYGDLNERFAGLPEGYNCFFERSRIDKLFNGKRLDFYEVAAYMWFLGKSIDEATCVGADDGCQEEAFDETVRNLKKQGYGVNAISRMLGVSSTTIRKTGRHGPRKPHNYTVKCGAKEKDWEKIDEEYLDKVKELIKESRKEGIKPVKITVSGTEKSLGLGGWNLVKMPKCKAEVEKAKETWKEFWAREVVWIYWELKKSKAGGARCITNLAGPLNLEHKQLYGCLEEIKKLDVEVYEAIKKMQEEKLSSTVRKIGGRLGGNGRKQEVIDEVGKGGMIEAAVDVGTAGSAGPINKRNKVKVAI